MTHAEMEELYELYVLDVLEPEFTDVINRHLAENCEHCQERILRARTLTAALAGTATRHQPPAVLRERVIRSITPGKRDAVVTPLPRRSLRVGLFSLSAAVAALLLGCIYIGYQNGSIRAQLERTSVLLESSNRDRAALEAALKDLSRSETRTVQFGKIDQPHGRVFVNRNRGIVFVASSLPRLAPNRTFQLWLVPNTGTPRSAGVFQADAQGLSVRVSQEAVDAGTKAVAVSVEPQSGSAAPTTTPIIVVPLAE